MALAASGAVRSGVSEETRFGDAWRGLGERVANPLKTLRRQTSGRLERGERGQQSWLAPPGEALLS